ncbi:MAG: elongation factor P [Chlamydiales bacterium]
MVKVSTSEFKVGLKIEVDNQPYNIVSNQHVKPGKGQAFYRVKLKNLLNGRVIERNFKSGETVETADVNETQMRLLYVNTSGATFMDEETFEQVLIENNVIEEIKQWLVEDQLYSLLFYQGNPTAVEPPTFMEMEIVETAPGVRGDTASGRVLKPAVTHTGAKIQVPIFVEQGEWVKVDTRNGEYVARVTK